MLVRGITSPPQGGITLMNSYSRDISYTPNQAKYALILRLFGIVASPMARCIRLLQHRYITEIRNDLGLCATS